MLQVSVLCLLFGNMLSSFHLSLNEACGFLYSFLGACEQHRTTLGC
jgi:hypothetical protein